ncbi:MAG: hypothetical protein ACLSUZ_05980 [Bifidobacterium pseudocatenulatum]
MNDDDLTYTKLRFDEKSLKFAAENLYRFDDALARSVIWLAFWDMTATANCRQSSSSKPLWLRLHGT